MPELPDLEVFKINVFNKLTSKRLIGLDVFNQRNVNSAQTTLVGELKGRDLASINRIGKELVFDFGDKKIVAAHLMLNGEMSIVDEVDVGKISYKIFAFNFEKESLVFRDMGGLCTIKYMPAMHKTPDAFDNTFTLEYFLNIAHKKPRVNVKAFLIDQSTVKGIGNAYVDEILWAARVSPHSIVGKIPDDILAALYTSIGSVLRNAIESIKNISPDIISGEERSFLKVHNKKIKKTETGYPIIIERIASKITYYTEEQVLYDLFH